MRMPKLVATAFALAVSISACANMGAGKIGQAVAPKAVSGAEALGAAPTCHEPHDEAEPFVVDWPAERRADLAAAMKQGVALVSYDCKGIALVRDCTAAGSYSFVGIAPEEKTVQLDDSDEVALNLSAGITAKLATEVQRGTTLDIALITVGRRMATRRSLGRPALEGAQTACDSATHFARAVSVGAFAMRSGTKGRVAATAELFGQSGGGASSSTRSEQTKAGSPDACAAAKAGAADAPANCEAPLRLLLVALQKEGTAADPTSDTHGEGERPACPKGFSFSAGKCARASAEVPHRCSAGALADCETQCQKGDAPSCTDAAVMYEKGKGTTRDDTKALLLYTKGCVAGDANACAGVGFMTLYGKGVTADARAAYEQLARACDRSSARGCNGVGIIHHRGKLGAKEPTRAAAAFDRACALGFSGACINVGKLLDDSELPKDDARMFSAFAKACELGDQRGCLEQAQLLREGRGALKDERKALPLERNALSTLSASCEKKDSAACETLARAHLRGTGTQKDPKKAITLFEVACAQGQADSCAQLGLMHAKGTGVRVDKAKSRKFYERGCTLGHEHSCERLTLRSAPGGRPEGALKPKTEERSKPGTAKGATSKPGKSSPPPVAAPATSAHEDVAASAPPAPATPALSPALAPRRDDPGY